MSEDIQGASVPDQAGQASPGADKSSRPSGDHPSRDTLYCSFCGKSQHEVTRLIAGPAVFICDECVDPVSVTFATLPTSTKWRDRDGSPQGGNAAGGAVHDGPGPQDIAQPNPPPPTIERIG